MAGTEGEDESTENAMRPPQSVVISSTEADEIPKSVDPPLLTGTVVAADVHAQTVSQPIAQSQLQYVMGPDGQMYAYEKAPFNWKHFCLGFFIPVGIIFGLPSLRIKGFYLAVATLAAQFFFEWLFGRVGWFYNYNDSGAIEVPVRKVFDFIVTGPTATTQVRYIVVLSIVVILSYIAVNILILSK